MFNGLLVAGQFEKRPMSELFSVSREFLAQASTWKEHFPDLEFFPSRQKKKRRKEENLQGRLY
jgi:hypothetical protein